MGLRSSIGANEQYVRNDPGRHRLDGLDRVRAGLDLRASSSARTRSCCRARPTPPTPTSRKAIATELTQIIEGIKQSANASYGGKYIMAGTAIETPPYQLGANDAYQGDEAGLDPAIAGIVREIGPGVTMTINTVAREILGDGQAAADNKLLHTLRDVVDHLNADDGPALRADGDGAAGPRRQAARRPRPQRRADEPPRGGDDPPGPDQPRAHDAALEHRGRRHREDDDRLQLAERRLPGRAACGREHRAVLAHGFPPLSR